MSDETEEQTSRAMTAINGLRVDGLYEYNIAVKGIMRDLLAGKFKEESLPEIARPPFGSGKETIHTNMCGEVRIEWSQAANGGWYVFGPYMPTKRAAIEAWNAVFGGQS